MKKLYITILFLVFGILNFHSVVIFAQSSTPVDTMIMNKTAEFNYETSSGVITLENYVTGEMKVAQEAKAVDVVLVLDYSSSMIGSEGSYSTDSTFTRVVADQYYRADKFYWKKGSSWLNYNSDSEKGSYGTSYTTGVQIYDSNKNAIKLNYNNQDREVYMLRVNDGNGTFRHWAYVLDGSTRVFVRLDGSFVREKGSTTVGYSASKWPKGEDDFYINPAQANDRPIFCSRKYEPAHTTTRSAALQFAAGKFIDNLKTHASKSGKTDRVAIIAFQGPGNTAYPNIYSNGDTEYLKKGGYYYLMEFPTDKKDASGNIDTGLDSRSFVTKRFTDISSTNAVDILKFAIAGPTCKSQTPVHNGMNLATELLTNYGRQSDDVARYVIVFTDGAPTQKDGNVWNSGEGADKAVQSAYSLKNSTTTKSIVYTIYCHSSDPATNPNNFMDHLSSNYPYAQKYNDNTKKLPADSAKYYKTAKDNLATVFDEITQEIMVETSSKYDINTTLNDFINNEYFQLPDGATQDDIFVIENKCTGYVKSTNTYSWAAEDDATKTKRLTEADGIEITITKGNRTLPKTDPGYNDRISISGYDYGKNWCGMDISKTPNVAHGARLIVKIPFVYTTTQVWGDLPTNSTDSGVTVVDPETHEEVEDKKYPVPTLPFCYIKLKRAGLHKGESAIYLIEKPNTSGGYDFVDKVVINGEGSGLDSCALYGVPGETFRITETNWNWAYHKTLNPQEKTVDKSIKPYEILFEFTGEHKVPDPSLSEHEKEKDPANLHNHDEAFKVNHLSLPPSPDLAPRPDAIEPKNGYELLPCPYFRE